MSMYEDPQGRLRRLLSNYAERPQVRLIDEVGEEHRLHPITDEEQIRQIQSFFEARQLYIADGHHRYTTALQYRDEVQEQRRGLHPQDGANFVLMALIDIDDPGWLVLPTHRILFDLSPQLVETLTPEHLASYFTVQTLPQNQSNDAVLQALAQAGQQHPSLVLKTSRHTLLLHANEQGRERVARCEHSSAWHELDVSIVQVLLLEEFLGLTPTDIATGRSIRYSHDTQHTLQELESGAAQAVVLLNGMPLRQVCAVADANDRMPQKSTYLYPKLITGLVMNPLW
jgi:uncharacterized protein (DUF1015 family)